MHGVCTAYAMYFAMQVNSQLQTSNPDVYAVGDIAAFPLTLYGGKLNRQEHVTHARYASNVLVSRWPNICIAWVGNVWPACCFIMPCLTTGASTCFVREGLEF